MTALHKLGILSTSFTWNAFPTLLKEFPHMLSTCWRLFLHSAVQLIPNHLNWVEVGWLWKPNHLMRHSITILLSQITLTKPGGVLCNCLLEKQMIVPLSANQMGWCITAECCLKSPTFVTDKRCLGFYLCKCAWRCLHNWKHRHVLWLVLFLLQLLGSLLKHICTTKRAHRLVW